MNNLQSEWESAKPINNIQDEWNNATPVTQEEWDSAAPAKPEESFISDVLQSGSKRISNISNPQPSAVRDFSPALGAGLNVAGQVGNFAGDVVGAGLRSAYRILPKTAQEGISSVGKAITTNPIVDIAKTAYSALPEGVQNDIGNIAGATMILPAATGLRSATKAFKTTAKETGAITSDLTNMFQRVIEPVTENVVDKEIKNIVKNDLNKSIKATTKGKQTLPLVEKYFDDAGTGIKEIINNKNNLNITNDVGEVVNGVLPETRLQMAQAIHSTEKKLFAEYDAMQKATTGKGKRLDLEPIAKQYDDVINNETLRATREGRAVIAHAEDAQEILRDVGTMSPQAAQDFIAQANNKLLNKNLLPVDVSKASADAGIASIMRKELDKLIESTEGTGYQDIKKRYGSVKSLREGTNKAAFASFAEKGTPNFFDITSGTALVHGLLSLNPATIVGGGFMEALNIARRKLRNPDTYVKKMFSDVDNLMSKKSEFIPESKTVQYLQNKFSAPKSNQFIDESGSRPTPLPLPPGQGFTTKGEPYDSGVIDVPFTSRTIPRLEGRTSIDPQLSLPSGQGFTTNEIVPKVSSSRLSNMYKNLDEEKYLKGLRNTRKRYK